MFTKAPTDKEANEVIKKCDDLQEEMLLWHGKLPKADPFKGTLHALIVAYQTDKDSRYHGRQYDGRRNLNRHLYHLDRAHGDLKLAEMGARHFKHIYERARWPDGNSEERGKISLAHGRMAAVRTLFSYGLTFEHDPNCVRLRGILREMAFENSKARTEAMTLRQCEDIIAAAHAEGLPSIALAQAIQFDFRVRQRDVIGMWVPETEPGISVIPPYRKLKWLRGIRHEEISSTMLLNHPVSKSRRHGKLLERDLSLYPMVMAEYQKIPADKRTGPLVICELTGRPWKAGHFRKRWRLIATAAGVPKAVWNMDNRAGGITETIEATGGDLEAARKEAGHSDITMTARYSRRGKEAVKGTAVIVADFRAKNKG